MQEVKIAKKRSYYAPYVKYSFYVPVIGEDGKKVVKRHPISQAIIFAGGQPMIERVQRLFTTVSANISKGLLSMYETDDPVEIEVLEGLVKDTRTRVMNEEEYERWRDPKHYSINKKLIEVEKKVAEKEDVIAQLTKQIEELTKPSTPQSARK